MRRTSLVHAHRFFLRYRHIGKECATAVCLLLVGMILGCDSGPVNYPSVPYGPEARVENPDWRPIDGDKPTMAKLGQEAMAALGYEEIIARAEKAGWIKTVRVVRAQSAAQKVLIADAATAAAGNELVKLLTKYAVLAGISAQADSPAPGPGDAVAVGIIVFGLMHVGYLKAEEILAAQQAQAATASAIPTATATTTTTAPPIAVPRRHPRQTCDDKRLDELEAAKKNACQGFPGKSCSEDGKNKRFLHEYPCSVIVARIAAVKACVAARQQVQDECFKNATDPGHAEQIGGHLKGIAWCEALEAVNCAPGHPMSGL